MSTIDVEATGAKLIAMLAGVTGPKPPPERSVAVVLRRHRTGERFGWADLYCPNGNHLAMYDDQKTYMDGVIRVLQDVDTGAF